MESPEKRVFVVLFLVAAVLISRGPNSMSGDAPHYLAASESLIRDLDLDLTNQYSANGDYPFRPEEPGGHVRVGRGGRMYPFHYIGLSLLMAPLLLVVEEASDFVPAEVLRRVRWDRVRACRDLLSLFMASLFAWTGVLSLRCCRRLLPRAAPSELAVLQAFAAPPLVSMSILVFTEIPAALISTLFLLESLETTPRLHRQLLAISLLPWLHVRYAVVSLAGFGWVLAQSLERRTSWSQRASQLAIPVSSGGLLSLLNWWMFESPLPWAQFDTGFPLTARHLVDGLAGQIVDRDAGLLWVAPFWVGAFWVLFRPGDLPRRYVAFAAAAFAGTWTIAAMNPMWWGGYSPAARFLVPVLPILVPALAEGYGRLLVSGKRWLLVAGLAHSLMMMALLFSRPTRLWSDPESGWSILTALPALHDLLPSFYSNLRTGLGFALLSLLVVTLTAPWSRLRPLSRK